MLGQVQLNALCETKELHGKVAHALGRGDRLAKDAPSLLFHGYMVVRGPDAQTGDSLIVQLADA